VEKNMVRHEMFYQKIKLKKKERSFYLLKKKKKI